MDAKKQKLATEIAKGYLAIGKDTEKVRQAAAKIAPKVRAYIGNAEGAGLKALKDFLYEEIKAADGRDVNGKVRKVEDLKPATKSAYAAARKEIQRIMARRKAAAEAAAEADGEAAAEADGEAPKAPKTEASKEWRIPRDQKEAKECANVALAVIQKAETPKFDATRVAAAWSALCAAYAPIKTK